jgi:ribosome-associated protein
MEQLSEQTDEEVAVALARFLDESGARECVALDVSQQSSFTDYFVIAGATSSAQMRGLQRRLHEMLVDFGLNPRQGARRSDESGWILLDCNTIVIHLMLDEQRQFYDLEKLWFDARKLYPADQDA